MQAMLSTAAKVEGSLNRVFISSGWLEARDSWMRFGFALVIACDLFVGVDSLVTRLLQVGLKTQRTASNMSHNRNHADAV